MSRRTSVCAGKTYGVRRVCKAWEVSHATYYARLKRLEVKPVALRRGPQGPLRDEQLVCEIENTIKESPFTAEGYRKIWAMLRYRGIRTSKERVRRLMREHNLQAPVRRGSPRRAQEP